MSYVEADKKYSDPRTDKSVKEKLKEKNICYKIDVSNEIVRSRTKQNKLSMSKFKKKGSGELPKISTASLPDIVFMLLFFFMVAMF